MTHTPRVSRRGLVKTAVLAGSAAVLAADAAVGAGNAEQAMERDVTPSAAGSARSSGQPVAARATRPSPAGLPVQSRPIYTLAEYRAVLGGPAFPSHAVALTLDDGPHPVWTPKVLKLLDKYHVPATFCLIGN
ncbi:polysaccharide deacetylase family protein, partial [Rugosimonospora africana]|uniref:polysaccharide deacetylase family protein n=1 Tax=Rugosimonospora africana TaxID=556532 RepID=UPI001EF1DF52